MIKKPLPRTSRAVRAIKTKNKLLKTATRLIDKYGYEEVTIEDISKQAGVSVGAFYHYYKSKTDILVELFKQIDQYFKQNEPKILSHKNAGERLTQFFQYYADFHTNRGLDHTRSILRVQAPFFNDRSRYMFVLLTRIITDACETGVFTQAYTTEKIVDYFLLIMRGLLFDWVVESGRYDLSERVATDIEITKRIFV
ncbi:MAG: TetR/AcrR family transcriptional regulator [Treponema sp.]|nr:TetR/AcrR family transcriptional regulator [Treponema sp.]